FRRAIKDGSKNRDRWHYDSSPSPRASTNGSPQPMRDAFLDRRLEVHVDIRRTVAKLDGKVLRYIAHRPLRNRGLAQIEEPRTALASAGDFLLHPDYGQPTRLISSRTISISRRYGRFLYSLAAHQK